MFYFQCTIEHDFLFSLTLIHIRDLSIYICVLKSILFSFKFVVLFDYFSIFFFISQEAGFSFVELNASDTRNAKSLKEVVSQSVGNTSIVDYIGSGSSTTHGLKHCLIMDEVDGMSGNEDRGGVQVSVAFVSCLNV
jgi:xanthine/uracil/vitamin C permease (AzgA family)